MTKRVNQNSISDFEESGRKLLKDVNSEAVKVEKAEFPQKSQLSYFIKNEKMIQVLKDKGIQRFFPVQYQTFEHIFKGKDLIARDRTGSGKTMAFSLPVIERFRSKEAFKDGGKVKFLIVVPTRELAIQVRTQIHSLRLRGDFQVVAVYGGSDIQEQIRKIRDGCDIIVSTPGRLIDLLERGAIKLSHLQVTCLDQADQMLKQGFQEDIEKIFQFIRKHGPPQKTQNLLFSATIPSWVVELSRTYLSPNREFIDLIKDSEMRTSKTVEHLALNCPYFQRNSVIADIVNLYGGRHGRTIIFCQTKKQANQILLKANLKQETQVLHGDIPQKQREVTFQSFKSGQLKCLVATNVAARGLDIPQVDLIVQLQPPKEIDTYIHRSGRTGRAGKSGVCLTFFTKTQLSLLERIERLTKIKMRKIGPPQPGDIVKASARDIVISLKTVEDSVLQYFNEIAEEMISQEGAVKALSKALAFISGNTKKISQRSILCSIEGYITYLLRCPLEYQSPGFIFSFLRKNINEEVSESIKGMRRVGKKSAVFDVPEEFKAKMDKLVAQCKQQHSHLKGYELVVVNSMEMLSEDEDDEKGSNQAQNEDFDDRDIQNAMRNRRDFQIFVGSLPPNADQRELADYFKQKKVKITNLRILRNEKGESKCVGFGLCLDKESVKRALDLDGDKFGSKSLRINLAAKK